jgi:hypothetical protein
LAWLATLTNEMIRSSNAEEITRDVLMRSAGLGLDAQLFSSNAGTATVPAGLLYNVTPTPPAASTSPRDAMLTDLAVIGGQVARVAGLNGLVFVCAPEQSIATKFRATDIQFPVLSSAALPAGTAIAIASNALASAFSDAPVVEAGIESSVVMADPAAEVVDIGGGVMASPLMSTFQTDTVALRLRLWASWVLRAPGAIAWVSGTNW